MIRDMRMLETSLKIMDSGTAVLWTGKEHGENGASLL